MSASSVCFRLVVRGWSRRAARAVLVGRLRARDQPELGRFTRRDVDRLIDATWRAFAAGASQEAPQPTLGARMNVRLARLTIALFDELLRLGAERRYAIELISDVTWRMYSRWGAVARLRRGRGVTSGFRGLRDGDVVPLAFPFSPPGYLARWVAAERGTAYDMMHCPVAAVFRDRDAADLCASAWCDLDHPLAEELGCVLVRDKTLVLGDDRCTFRWLPR